jgi:hypothetical protein
MFGHLLKHMIKKTQAGFDVCFSTSIQVQFYFYFCLIGISRMGKFPLRQF